MRPRLCILHKLIKFAHFKSRACIIQGRVLPEKGERFIEFVKKTKNKFVEARRAASLKREIRRPWAAKSGGFVL